MSNPTIGSIHKNYRTINNKMVNVRLNGNQPVIGQVWPSEQSRWPPYAYDQQGLTEQQIWESVKNREAQAYKNAFVKTLKTFCSETTLHGIKNTKEAFDNFQAADTRQKKIYKFVSLITWISAFGSGTIFALILMYLVWSRYDSSPTITTVETTNYPIWKVPFPAVTICNINKVFAPATKNISDILQENGIPEEKASKFFTTLDKLVSPEYIDYIFFKAFDILERYNYTTERLMLELMVPCSIMMSDCSWLGKPIPCETLFRVAKSSEGFCCSFNYKALKNSLEVHSEPYIDEPVYRVSGAGVNIGLGALVQIQSANYMAYSQAFYGAWILIHGPEDYPQASVTTQIGQPGCDLSIAVTPSILISEPAIRKVPLDKRNCYFDDERKLRTTDRYSYQSCITECAVDAILKKCQCLPFYYPEINIPVFSKKFRQCTLRDVKCLRDYRHIFYSLQPADKPIDLYGENEVGMECHDCLPGCSEENYSVETNTARRFSSDGLRSTRFGNTKNLSNFLTIKIHFKDISCIKYRRDIYQTWDALLASFGGIFGLCLGGSVISIVELFYFFTFRFYHNLIEEKHKNYIRNNAKPETEGNIWSKPRISVIPIGKNNNQKNEIVKVKSKELY